MVTCYYYEFISLAFLAADQATVVTNYILTQGNYVYTVITLYSYTIDIRLLLLSCTYSNTN